MHKTLVYDSSVIFKYNLPGDTMRCTFNLTHEICGIRYFLYVHNHRGQNFRDGTWNSKQLK